MVFIVYGQDTNSHPIVLEKIFDRRTVEKIGPVTPKRSIHQTMDHAATISNNAKNHPRGIAKQVYQTIDQLPSDNPVLFANQIMTTPVVTLSPQATVEETLQLFQEKQFRHVPVVSLEDTLIGIVSDRDILRYMGGVVGNDASQQALHKSNDKVAQLMKPRVLTASVVTDVRYIARLFVEQHVGAMPIMKNGQIEGIITRSDILRAVMRHFVLELWA